MAEIFEPPVAKQFWLTTAANPGIYIVLAGKVRVLDNEENLITTLSAGSSFGEATLFAQEAFQPYAVRASTNLKLCYLKQEILLGLMDRFPGIVDRLFKRAELWDLVMLYRQNSQLLSNPLDVPGILKALSLFERHNLSLQQQTIIPNDCKLLLLQKGELRNSEGHTLTPGKIYSEAKPGAWQATQPVVAYILRDSNWQIAKEDWQQLSEFVELEERKAVVENQKTPRSKPKPERITSSGNVISFPQREPSPKQKQKKFLPYFPSPKVKVRQVWGSLTKTYPFYAQQSSADCGAACLAMIGRYWGKQFSVNRLREQANVSRSGSSLRALAAAAESLGFSTRPVKASLDKFAEQPLPAIAHWQGKHYIVVYKITNKQVIVAD
ncbi:MAG: cyclic nucleotide-binding domain-containing protein, partial [Nostoc indistinguendum CM1-VF10]|nr:cyclic nucleotide-binding domain-containing protein [Nostoc indistinguendum CM1-VF10]